MTIGKRFPTDNVDQGVLLPPSRHDCLPGGHLARPIADVIEELDLGVIYRSYLRRWARPIRTRGLSKRFTFWVRR